ncbi:MAG: MbnP family protein [Flavobacteriales bacterium]
MKKFVFLFALAPLLWSCDPDDPKPVDPVVETVKVTVNPIYGTQPFYMDSVYTTAEGYKVKFTELVCYFSLLKNGTNDLIQAALFDYRETGNVLVNQTGDHTKFANLSGKIGVDTTLNHLDPSAFPNNSPLNISNAGIMHWGWNPGYIFVNLEGKVDTIVDATNNLDLSFSFHIGTDTYLQAFDFNNVTWQDKGNHVWELPLKLDLAAFLTNPASPINLKNEHLTHTAAGQETLTQKVIQNFKNALTSN